MPDQYHRLIKFWLLILMVFIGCEEEPSVDFPLIHTGEVTDVNDSGAVFHAYIANLGEDNIREHGFIWSNDSLFSQDNLEKYIIRKKATPGPAEQYISTTLQAGNKYFVRAFIISEKYLSYGKIISFTSRGSIAPGIKEITPLSGNINDTILIIGESFSYQPGNNLVHFNHVSATVVFACQDTLKVIVPESLDQEVSTISVSVYYRTVTYAHPFQLIGPVISSFIPPKATFRSTITIQGENFNSNPESIVVQFGGYIANIQSIGENTIEAIVPDKLDTRTCNITVEMNNLSVTSTEFFTIQSLVLEDFNPHIAVTGDMIKITGENFSPIPEYNWVTVSEFRAEVVSASVNEIIFILPLQDVGYYPAREVPISVEVLGDLKMLEQEVLINDRWFRMKDYPGTPQDNGNGSFYSDAEGFGANGIAYIGLNNTAEFWKFDPSMNEWERIADFPGTPRWRGTGFALGNSIYFGTGINDMQFWGDWWEYNILSDSWIRKNDFGGTNRAGAVSFVFNDTGYIGTGLKSTAYTNLLSDDDGLKDVWRYNKENDSWEQVAEKPGGGMWDGVALENNGLVYIGMGFERSLPGRYNNKIYAFDVNQVTWSRIPDCPGSNPDLIGFSPNQNQSIYIGRGYYDSQYFCSKYNILSNQWELFTTGILFNVNTGVAITMDNKVYIGLGKGNSMWEYDPSR